jgi:hypothetical protein
MYPVTGDFDMYPTFSDFRIAPRDQGNDTYKIAFISHRFTLTPPVKMASNATSLRDLFLHRITSILQVKLTISYDGNSLLGIPTSRLSRPREGRNTPARPTCDRRQRTAPCASDRAWDSDPVTWVPD